MRVLAIDPGPAESAWVILRDGVLERSGKYENKRLLNYCRLRRWADDRDVSADVLVIEMIASMGMAVGAEVFETCIWIGRFVQAWGGNEGVAWHRVKRLAVKMNLCHDSRAKDCNIRQAIIDRYGGKDAAIGRKKTPGPLYGVSGDVWSALAVGLTFVDTRNPVGMLIGGAP